MLQKEQNDQCLIWLVLAFFDPLRDPVIIVAICATFVEEVGYYLPWYILLFVYFENFLVIRIVTRIIMDIFCLCLDVLSVLWRKWQKRRMREVVRYDIQISKDSTLEVVAP